MSHADALKIPRSPPRGALSPVRVLVVDDSAVVRSAFSGIVKREPDLELVAVASSAEQALTILGKSPADVILLDLEMPGMGGLEALPLLSAAAPRARIMVVSSLTEIGAEATLAALSAGAADTLAKPKTGGFSEEYRLRLLLRLRALGRTAAGRRLGERQPVAGVPPVRAAGRKGARVLAIGASTGGIHALSKLLGALPPRVGMPILVTQHLPHNFMEAFCRQLEQASGRKASVATEGALLRPDEILVAPGDAHMTVAGKGQDLVVRLDRRPVANGCMPSVDPMFASLAEVLDGRVTAIVLSGMGRDGTGGALGIVEAGGTVLAQDEPTCAVWGMPGSVAKAGLAAAILPPDQIAAHPALRLRGPR